MQDATIDCEQNKSHRVPRGPRVSPEVLPCPQRSSSPEVLDAARIRQVDPCLVARQDLVSTSRLLLGLLIGNVVRPWLGTLHHPLGQGIDVKQLDGQLAFRNF